MFCLTKSISGRFRFHILSVVACLALSACSASDVVNALTPDAGYSVSKAIPYGRHERQQLDIYTPDEPRADAPLVMFFYGGGWDSGARTDYKFIGQAFATQGYTVAIPDYRLYPEVTWQGFMSDGAQVLAYLDERYSGKSPADHGVVLVGHSAGAYIAAMLALDPSWLDTVGLRQCYVRAVIGLAGPYDFLPLRDDKLKRIFGPGPVSPETQPINHVDPEDPPMMLATGRSDRVVLPRNSAALAAKLRAAGVTVGTPVYDDVGHVEIVGAMADPLRFLAPTHDDVFAYLANTRAMRAPCQDAPKP